MIVRKPLKCISCDSKIVTRTQIGHRDRQEHGFPCPECGVPISFVIDLNQKKATFKFKGEPKNGKWVSSDKNAAHVLTFSDEISVPVDIP